MSARHTVASLLATVSAADLAAAIGRLYWADQDKDLDAYLDLRRRLCAMAPAATELVSVVLSREWSEDDPPQAVFHVSGKALGCGEQLVGIEYVPWPEWLSLPIETEPAFELSDADMLANILYEMSWAGFEEEEIAAQKAEIIKRKEEVEAMIAEGRIDELPFVKVKRDGK